MTFSPGRCRVAAALASVLFAAAQGVMGQTLQAVAETDDGILFAIETDSLRPHPMGHAITVRAWGAKPRRLWKADPASPEFVRIESQWIVDCRRGTYVIVLDRFFDGAGAQVAEFRSEPQEQERPVHGSISHAVLLGACAFIGVPGR